MATTPTPTRVLLASILNNNEQVTMQHAIFILGVQAELATNPVHSIQLNFSFFQSPDEGLKAFEEKKNTDYDALVMVASHIAPSKDWLFKALSSGYDRVTGYYPLAGVNFSKVQALKEAGCKDIEKLKKVGMNYNVASFLEAGDNGWRKVCFKDGQTGWKDPVYTSCFYMSSSAATDDDQASLWTNVEIPVVSSQPYAFIGSPGYRGAQIR